MKNWISVAIFFFLAIIFCTSASCTSKEIAIEVSNSLIKMTDDGIANIDSEIIRTDQQLTAVEQKLLKLEQVVTPAMKWVDYQKTIIRVGDWRINVTSEELDKFKNDYYKVTTLEFLYYQGKYSSMIEVRDLTTGAIYDSDTLQDDLTLSKGNLTQQRKVKVEKRNVSASTINNVLKYFNEWTIQKLDDSIYSISGIGLGWAERLTAGNWTYYKADGKLVPRGIESEKLKSILSGS